jgi:DNA-binding CsgD family transcriptional regulator
MEHDTASPRTFKMNLSAETRADADDQGPLDISGPVGAVDLMDVISMPLCILNRDLQIVRANGAARHYVGEQGGDGFLRLLDLSVACSPRNLRQQVRTAIELGARISLIVRSDEFPPLICTIKPIQTDQACGVVALTPLKSGSSASIPSLRNIYSLSQAEAEVALGSAAGLDVVELAQARQVSINTLRAQIASIKSKMGLSRMTEIAVVVCRIEAAMTWL